MRRLEEHHAEKERRHQGQDGDRRRGDEPVEPRNPHTRHVLDEADGENLRRRRGQNCGRADVRDLKPLQRQALAHAEIAAFDAVGLRDQNDNREHDGCARRGRRHQEGDQEIGDQKRRQHHRRGIAEPRDHPKGQTPGEPALFKARRDDERRHHQPDDLVAEHAKRVLLGPPTQDGKQHDDQQRRNIGRNRLRYPQNQGERECRHRNLAIEGDARRCVHGHQQSENHQGDRNTQVEHQLFG